MKWALLSIFLILSLSSCGQELKSRRIASEGQEHNVLQVQDCNSNSGSVCAQPPMPECPVGMGCIQVFPAPQTYQSECEMDQAKAEFIQNGPCPSTTL